MDRRLTVLAALGTVVMLVLLTAGCAGKTPRLGKAPTDKAQALYAEARQLQDEAWTEAESRAAAEALVRAVRAGSPAAACDLAEIYFGWLNQRTVPAGFPAEVSEPAAFGLYLQAAQAGYAPAQYRVAELYADARGTQRDMAEARGWLLKAAANGSGAAQLRLGASYSAWCGCGPDCDCGSSCSYGLARDYAQSFYWYELATDNPAQQVRAQGAASLARAYEGGLYGRPDYAKAAAMYERAIAEGSAESQDALAFLYFRGQGVSRDYERAARLLEDLVQRRGEAVYGYNLGVLYYYAPQGPEQARRNREAVRLFRAAAADGWPIAQSALGECYEFGVGVPRDYAAAANWYGLAAEQGFADAQFLLGDLYRRGLGVKRDYREALRLFELASGQGLAWGSRGLADLYYHGYGTARDLERAFSLYERAAFDNDQEAMYRLAQMYERGQAAPRDLEQARLWYQAVAEYPEADGHYWDPDKVRQYRAKGEAALRRLGS